MKKLTKLKLKEFHEMSDSEMKNVVGGYDSGNDDSYYGPQCSVGSNCKVVYVNEYDEVQGSVTGTCQQSISGNSITCFCDAISPNKPLTNQGGMSHCWKS